MRLSRISAGLACLLTTVLVGLGAGNVRAAPQVFWASDPVHPNETVVLQGSDFGDGATVEVARLADDAPAEAASAVEVKGWIRVPILQASECSLKFALPADAPMGIFACRVTAHGGTSAPALVNVPDPWWMQGDRGAAVTPGGWLRVCGKSLSFGPPSSIRLEPKQGAATVLKAIPRDGYSLGLDIPASLAPGAYTVYVHNGFGGKAGWRKAGALRVEVPQPWPTDVFNVLDTYGSDATAQMRKTLNKYSPVPDRTEGIRAALKKAEANGGGIVYFPAGRYGIKGDLAVPPRTMLKGEGMGLVVLWWSTGRFNLDGGSDQGLEASKSSAELPGTLIHGSEFGLENMSLYLPLAYQTGISSSQRFIMRKVRVRVDHHWAMDGSKRPEGVVAFLGNNAEVTDCDILAKGAGLIPKDYCYIGRNRLMAGKTNCPLGGTHQLIVEDNHFVSLFPTAYQNIAGVGRNIYYARNWHEAFHVHQADYSFTFDAGDGAYWGQIAATHGTHVTLAADPDYPKWAPEKSEMWRNAVVLIQDGRGAGQYRHVVANHGRQWTIDRPFDCPPDDTSWVTIVPMNGRVLVIGNRFEDANWVNASYGTAIDVVFAANQLYRCASLLNYGCQTDAAFQPSWYVQFLDNGLHEGLTSIETMGSVRNPQKFPHPITRCTIHRRNFLDTDNSGDISVAGFTRDVLVEGCTLHHPAGTIRVQKEAKDVLLRNNTTAHDKEAAE